MDDQESGIVPVNSLLLNTLCKDQFSNMRLKNVQMSHLSHRGISIWESAGQNVIMQSPILWISTSRPILYNIHLAHVRHWWKRIWQSSVQLVCIKIPARTFISFSKFKKKGKRVITITPASSWQPRNQGWVRWFESHPEICVLLKFLAIRLWELTC